MLMTGNAALRHARNLGVGQVCAMITVSGREDESRPGDDERIEAHVVVAGDTFGGGMSRHHYR
jgi:hypothetical protein